MCGPVAAIGAIGALVQGFTSMQAANYNAAAAQAEAKRIRQLGAVQEASDRRGMDYQLGQQQVDLAAAGRSGATGSALELAFHSRREGELDVMAKRAGYTMRSDSKENEATLHRYEGVSSLIGSGFSAAGKLLGGATKQIPALG